MEKINTVLVEVLKVSAEDAVKNLQMKDVTKWDSLSHMDLIVKIEEVFAIQLTGDDIAEMITFDSIRAIVSRYIK